MRCAPPTAPIRCAAASGLRREPVREILTQERLEALYGAPVHTITDASGTAFVPG